MAGIAAPGRRYVIRDVIGRGGMGVVYRAYDTETRRDVTMKTLLDVTSPAMLDLFRKECDVLSRLNHPNIVDIYDIGELVDAQGKRQPYFVMPLLPGVTLDTLISGGSHRLTVERAVEIIAQAARGLHAAHDRGLVHRDIKPSNIFVLEDDSVKLIDFGVAHLATGHSHTSIKGTLHYMAPEQLQAKKPTPSSDLFSLGVVCYEALTRRKPFDGASAEEVVQGILHQNPLPASELNPAVNRSLAQVVQKALAKQAMLRFSSMREFAEHLQKAVRGGTIAVFDESRMQARLERARKALTGGELEFAGEILGGLESEGYTHPDMAPLVREIERVRRDKTISVLMESSRRCVEEEEYQLALQKIQEILQIDPRHAGAAALRSEIESRRSSEQVSRWMSIAQQHIDNYAYSHARQALEDVLRIEPDLAEARTLLSKVELGELEHGRLCKEKEKHYQSALESFGRGEVTAALSDLERVMLLVRQAPDNTDPERTARYETFYDQVRSDHDALQGAYDDARKKLAARDFERALARCTESLARYPGHALFQALKVDVEEAQRQALSAAIARIDREADAEPDLERRVSMLREAVAAHPGEAHFERSLKLAVSKRDLVASIVAKARTYEDRRQFAEALNQWEVLRTVYGAYPGLQLEVERVARRRDEPEPEPVAPAAVVTPPEPAAAPRELAPPPPDPPVSRRRLPIVWAAAPVALALIAFGAVRILRHPAPPPVALLPVPVATDPPGARVSVDGRVAGSTPLTLNVSAGVHLVTLSLAGYKEVERSWSVAAGFSPPPERLEAYRPRLQFNSDLADAQMVLDGEARASADAADLSFDATHQLQLAVGGSRTDMSFRSTPGALPELQFSAAGTGAPVIVVSTLDAKGRIYTSTPWKVSVDGGKSYRDAGPGGLDLDALPGDGILTLQDADGLTRMLVVAQEHAPMVQAFVLSAKPPVSPGGLSIDSSESDFVLLVDGKRTPYSRKGPPYAVYNVPEGSHKVQLRKEGYRIEPESLQADVKANRSTPLKFTVSALTPSLILQGAVSGTNVSVGGRVLGEADAKGDFRVELPPGSIAVTLSKDGYRPRTLTRIGTIGPPQSRLEPITGTIRIDKEPALGMHLKITQVAGVPMETPSSYEEAPAELSLPVGKYLLEFSAQGRSETVGPVGLGDGQVLRIPINLVRR